MGVKYLDSPKSSRIKYLDVAPKSKFMSKGREVSEEDFFKPQPMQITSPIGAAVKAASEFVPGTQFATQYYAKGGPFNKRAISEAEAVARPLEEAQVRGLGANLAYGGTAMAPILLGAPTPFMKGAGTLLKGASKIPMLGKLARMPVAKTALGFGGYEAAKAAAGGQDVGEGFREGAVGGAIFHGGSRLGATALGKIPAKHAERVGSAVGAAVPSLMGEGDLEQKVAGAMVGGAFGAKFPAKPFGTEANVGEFVVKKYKKAVGPRPKDTAFKIKKYNDSIVEVVKDMSENLKQTPISRKELFDAAETRQGELIKEINGIVSKSNKGIKVDTIDVGNKVADYARDENVKTLAPELAESAQKLAQRIFALKGRSISEAHDMMIKLNQMARASYSNPSPHKLTAVEMYRKAADALREKLNSTVDGLVDSRYSGLKKKWGSYEELMKDLTRAGEKELAKTQGQVAGGMDAFILGDLLGSAVSQNPAGVARAVGIKGVLELNKYLNSPEKNIGDMFKQSTKAFKPRSYAFDEALANAKEAVFGAKPMPEFAFSQAGKASATDAEIVEPIVEQKRIPFAGPQRGLLSGQVSEQKPIIMPNQASGEAIQMPRKKAVFQPKAPAVDIQKQFKNAGDPALLDYLSSYLPAKYVASLTPERRLELGNMKATDLQDFYLKYGSKLGDESTQRHPKLGFERTVEQKPMFKKISGQEGSASFSESKGEKDVAISDLLAEARKYKTLDEFMEKFDVFHGTPAEIEGGKLKFGAGKQLKKGGYMGGHFLTDKEQIAQAFQFGGKVYRAKGDIKNKVFDVNKNKNLFKNFVGQKYKNQDGELETFTQQHYDFMFPDGKDADWATVYSDLAEQFARERGNIGIAIKEYAGGTEGMTYQIFKDEIPVYTKDNLTALWHEAQKGKVSNKPKSNPTDAFGILGPMAAASAAVAAGAVFGNAKKAEASGSMKSQISDEDGFLVILGEGEGETYEGKLALGSALRNRGKLKGVFGKAAIVKKDGKYYRKGKNGLRLLRDKAVQESRKAWAESKKKDYSNGSDHWESTDFPEPEWSKKMKKTMKVGKHQFYKSK